jgi:hypothetical protein
VRRSPLRAAVWNERQAVVLTGRLVGVPTRLLLMFPVAASGRRAGDFAAAPPRRIKMSLPRQRNAAIRSFRAL